MATADPKHRKRRYYQRGKQVLFAKQHVRIAILVRQAGGKCSRCGYSKSMWALEFHHRDRATKTFTVGVSNGTRSMRTLLAEAAKCDLVCANCHREIEESRHADRKQSPVLFSLTSEERQTTLYGNTTSKQ